jgi:D-arabinose 1-dehydrogenase-like Zn-dependent alcohol dehydrogenase
MMMGAEPRLGMGHRGMGRGFGGFGSGAIQISSDFTANVTNIVKNDVDVQNLLNQGYNITVIRPVISTTVDGNGNVVTKASSADVMLLGTNGRAFVVIDLTQAKVTKIVTLTITEIDK